LLSTNQKHPLKQNHIKFTSLHNSCTPGTIITFAVSLYLRLFGREGFVGNISIGEGAMSSASSKFDIIKKVRWEGFLVENVASGGFYGCAGGKYKV
jgi:hypothetical protein